MTENEFSDEGLRDALQSAADALTPAEFRARLRAELETEIERARRGASRQTLSNATSAEPPDDRPHLGDRADPGDHGFGQDESGDDPVHGSGGDTEHCDDADVVLLPPSIDPDARSIRARRSLRLGWAAAALLIVGAATVGVRILGDDDAESRSTVAATVAPIDPVVLADQACRRFVEDTGYAGATLEVLVSNGRQQWTDLGIDAPEHLDRMAEAVARLQSALGTAGFEGPDADVVARAISALDDVATLTEAASDLDQDAALDVVSRLRDPLVAAERELASIGVAGCT